MIRVEVQLEVMIKVEEEVITKLEVVPIWIGKEELEVRAKLEELEVQAKLEELEVRAKPEVNLEVQAKLEALTDETDWIGKKATLEDITKLEMILIWIGKEATPGVITKPEEALEAQAKLEAPVVITKPGEAPEAQAKLEESEVQARLEVEVDQVHKVEVLILIGKKKSEVTVKRELLPSNKLSHLS